ncbi:MAG: hypothetical protein QNJ62_06610 [Methyloceanibacter sp.]|nr:hypothetical protein [Methyloceanibacter sp.]
MTGFFAVVWICAALWERCPVEDAVDPPVEFGPIQHYGDCLDMAMEIAVQILADSEQRSVNEGRIRAQCVWRGEI